MRIAAYLAALVMLCGCSTAYRSDVADTLGYSTDSRVIGIGPYQIHYGSDGTNDLLLVAEGNHNLFARRENESTAFVGGRSFIDYTHSDGVVTKFMIHIRDADGNDTVTLVDDDANGIIDHNIDHINQTIYDWKKDRWEERDKK